MQYETLASTVRQLIENVGTQLDVLQSVVETVGRLTETQAQLVQQIHGLEGALEVLNYDIGDLWEGTGLAK